jgi:hypothetical protein
MPGFRKMNPAPKIALTRVGAGVHSFWKAEKDLPVGIVLRTWSDAVVGEYLEISQYACQAPIPISINRCAYYAQLLKTLCIEAAFPCPTHYLAVDS